MADLNIDGPIPGQEDLENGIVILCPTTTKPEQTNLGQEFFVM